MPKLAANLSMMFHEFTFEDRFSRAAQAGFKGVEFLFPYEYEQQKLINLLISNNLELALFNMPSGDWDEGERGLASVPGKEQIFADYLPMVQDYAKALNCKSIHMMAGIKSEATTYEDAEQVYIRNLKLAARSLTDIGVTIMIEPINHRDMPGYFLRYQDQAIELIKKADEPNIKLQMDFYHCQITEGDLVRRFEQNFNMIGHMQIAGPPDRHEPDSGEVNYPYLFNRIDALDYQGWIGCEYRPRNGTLEGLGWAKDYL